MIRLLVDGDAITFMAASTSDGRTYIVEATIPPTRALNKYGFKYKKEAVAFCNEHDIDVEEIKLEYHPEPDSHACQNAKKLMEGIIKTAVEYGKELENPVEVVPVVVLKGGGTNFREKIYPDYKVNRKDAHIPHHIPTVTSYLLDRYETVLAYDQEVDDVLGILQCYTNEDSSIIASHDKDLDMIPGHHIRIKRGGKHEAYHIDDFQADYNFYTQMLTGDKVDNIPGISGIGPKKAGKILEEAYTPSQMYDAVVSAYLDDAGDKLDLDDVTLIRPMDDMLTDKGRLLWIRRREGELWIPPVII